MIYYKKYDNGLKLIVNKMEGMLSVSAGILVGAGSCLETAENNGISHFIEHTTFKGTEKYDSFSLSAAFDDIGAQVNAFTSKEMTVYYVKSLYDKAERSFDLLSDMFLNATYSSEELEKEKGVVIEEINMAADTPEDVCFDNLAEVYFGKNGLGRTILGPSRNIRAFTREDILKYRKKYYNADNVVISFAGNISGQAAEELTEKYFLPFISSEKSDKTAIKISENFGKVVKRNKDIEQVHLGFAYKGIKFDGEYSDELSLINAVLGSGMSSRLFRKVREELGLCYTIYSYPSGYRNQGTFAVYAGVNTDSAGLAAEAISGVLKEFAKNGASGEEIARAKAQFLSSFAFGQENTSAQMILYGKHLLFTGKVFDIDGKIKNIETTSDERINEFVRQMDFENRCVSVYGKNASKVVIDV